VILSDNDPYVPVEEAKASYQGRLTAEIIVEHYTPVPQRARMYGDVEDQVQFPTTPDEWATDHWQRFATQKDPSSRHQTSRLRYSNDMRRERQDPMTERRRACWTRTLK
jgi:hypothetical protein